jgi:hypothetical protein
MSALRYLRPIYWWHRTLRMKHFSLDWHIEDMTGELEEYHDADGWLHHWSELSDVVYTHSRTTVYDGYEMDFPLSLFHYMAGLPYMYGKYSSRWLFYHLVGKKFGSDVRAVLNPKKEEKLRRVAGFFDLPPDEFVTECIKLQKKWLFLP